MSELVTILSENPYFKIPQYVLYDSETNCQVWERIEGNGHEADEFPEEVAYQLGQFIGYMHKKTFKTCGMYPEIGMKDIKERMSQSMKQIIDIYWQQDDRVNEYYAKLIEKDIPISGYSLIMADISANQFLFSNDMKSIIANVDLDAYVVGPREWELSILETCVLDRNAFILGYEEHLPMPNIECCKSYYQFLMYLNGPWDKTEMNEFLDKYL